MLSYTLTRALITDLSDLAGTVESVLGSARAPAGLAPGQVDALEQGAIGARKLLAQVRSEEERAWRVVERQPGRPDRTSPARNALEAREHFGEGCLRVAIGELASVTLLHNGSTVAEASRPQ